MRAARRPDRLEVAGFESILDLFVEIIAVGRDEDPRGAAVGAAGMATATVQHGVLAVRLFGDYQTLRCENTFSLLPDARC